MIASKDNSFAESISPHSIGLQNTMTVPSPGFDSNPLLIAQKKDWGRKGIGGLAFDGTGLLGTGLFSGDISTWGVAELIAGLVAGYAIYAMFFQAKQTKYRMEIAAGRRRKKRAVSYRAKAKKLEEQTEGIF